MPLVCSGEDDLTVLTNQPGKQLELLLKRQFNRQLDQRTEAYNALKSRADCEQWQRERREFFIRQIGGFPERTPLLGVTFGTEGGTQSPPSVCVCGGRVALDALRIRQPSVHHGVSQAL